MWEPKTKNWLLSISNYDKVLSMIEREVTCFGDTSAAASMYKSSPNFYEKEVIVKPIPDFVFNLDKIEIPFSNNLAFDMHLSKLKYENDEQKGYNEECMPESIR